MRRSLIFLALVMFSVTGSAFQDHVVNTHLDELRSRLQADGDAHSRLVTFEKFRDSLDRYLRGDERGPRGSSWGAAPVGSTTEEMDEFADLNEFGEALFSVRLNPPSKANCAKAKNKVIAEGSFRRDGTEASPLVMASAEKIVADLIDLICR